MNINLPGHPTSMTILTTNNCAHIFGLSAICIVFKSVNVMFVSDLHRLRAVILSAVLC